MESNKLPGPGRQRPGAAEQESGVPVCQDQLTRRPVLRPLLIPRRSRSDQATAVFAALLHSRQVSAAVRPCRRKFSAVILSAVNLSAIHLERGGSAGAGASRVMT